MARGRAVREGEARSILRKGNTGMGVRAQLHQRERCPGDGLQGPWGHGAGQATASG